MMMTNGFTKFLLVVCLAVACLMGCSTVKYLPAESQTVTHYVDSVRWDTRDSVILIEKSVYKDYTGLLDTLVIESGIARAKAWADTTHNILNGSLEGKSYVQRETKIEYRDRIVERTDTLRVKEPYPVEKVVNKTPKIMWWIVGYSVLLTALVGLYIGFKLK